jgi:hypothetical protein
MQAASIRRICGAAILVVGICATLLIRPAPGGDLLCTATSSCPCFECRNKRSGYSQCTARYAHPSRECHGVGYYVGGGAAFGGDYRCCDEGTWGWDYLGRIPKAIQLKWWHGRRYQGGTGAYRTDGPHLSIYD